MLRRVSRVESAIRRTSGTRSPTGAPGTPTQTGRGTSPLPRTLTAPASCAGRSATASTTPTEPPGVTPPFRRLTTTGRAI
nr:MAG TPA: hypothetical protein [Caudoviricetes sp.]